MADVIYSRFVKAETVRLELTRGDWILVRKRLNAGEHRRMLLRMMKPASLSILSASPMNGHDAAMQVDQTMATLSTTLAYLLDWSFVDPDGKPVVIRGRSIEDLTNALEALDIESFAEITHAIQAHVEGVDRELEAAKASPFGDAASSLTSTSVA